jgi:hypothetical protein
MDVSPTTAATAVSILTQTPSTTIPPICFCSLKHIPYSPPTKGEPEEMEDEDEIDDVDNSKGLHHFDDGTIMIPKPIGPANRPGRSGYTLLNKLHWDDYDAIYVRAHYIALALVHRLKEA